MADTSQKTKILGYLPVAILEGLPEWKAYAAAVKLADRQATKAAVKALIKAKLPDLDEDAVIDFIRYDEDRLQVYQDLQPKKGGKRRGTDLSDLFTPQEPAPASKPRSKLG